MYHSYFRILCILTAVFASLCISPSGPRAESIDRVVAVVNDEVITLSELNNEAAPLFEKIRLEYPADQVAETIAEAREKVLDELVEQELIVQHAKKINISVSEEDVTRAIQSMLDERKASFEEFKRSLEAAGIDEKDYRENVEQQLLRARLLSYEVRSKIVITEEKLKNYYEQEYANPENIKPGYHILQIGFKWGPAYNRTRQEAQEKAGNIRKLVIEGQDFRELARSFSDLSSAQKEGDLGYFHKDELASYMRDIILNMNPGDISPVIETSSGFQFFKLLSVKDGEKVMPPPLEAVKPTIMEELFQKEMKERFESWITQLREKAYIKKLL